MRIEWMLLAEGVTQDARGAFAAVGINQNVFAADTFPAHTKRAVITRISELPEHRKLSVRYAVVSPQGKTMTAQESEIELGEKRIADLPASLDIPSEFVLVISELGEHRVEFEITDRETNETALSYVSIHVVEPSAFGALVGGG